MADELHYFPLRLDVLDLIPFDHVLLLEHLHSVNFTVTFFLNQEYLTVRTFTDHGLNREVLYCELVVGNFLNLFIAVNLVRKTLH